MNEEKGEEIDGEKIRREEEKNRRV